MLRRLLALAAAGSPVLWLRRSPVSVAVGWLPAGRDDARTTWSDHAAAQDL